MIIDDISNIKKYEKLIPENIIEFLTNLKSDINAGRYEIDSVNYVNIDEYTPRDVNLCKFEAHKDYIDIQMVLQGEEAIDITGVKDLEISEAYDAKRDIMFFKSDIKDFDRIHLTPYKFILIYPHEAHRPQVKTTDTNVKKAVAKVRII